MFPEDSNVYDLKEATSVADDSPHSHRLKLMKNLDSKERIGQTPSCCFSSLRAEASADAKSLISLNRGYLVQA